MENDTSMMAVASTSRHSKLLNAMFPRRPDFYGRINDQCDLAAQRKEPGEDLELLLGSMDQAGCSSVVKGFSFAMEALKRREIYRHLSDAADHIAHAGDILHDIIVKSA